MKLYKIPKSINSKNIYTSNLNVAAYVRVSTIYENQIFSYDSQIRYYENVISKNNNWNLVKIYADYGISGTSINKRKEFQTMINDSLEGKIDVIITKSISRFARNSEDLLKIVRLLRNNNVGVYFEEEKIFTLRMESEFLLTVLASVAQQESLNTSNHIKLGRVAMMKEGKLNNGKKRYGYDIVDGKLIINKAEAKIVKKVFKLYCDGYSSLKIADLLNKRKIPNVRNSKWDSGLVRYMLSNELYIGSLVQRKRKKIFVDGKYKTIASNDDEKYIIENNHDAIISKEIFKRVQEILQINNPRNNCSIEKRKELIDNLYCGYCNHKINLTKYNNKNAFYECNNTNDKSSRNIKDELIENAFIQSLKKLLRDKYRKEIINNIMTESKVHNDIKNKLKSLYLEQSILMDKYIDKKINISDMKNVNNRINEKIEIFKEKLTNIDNLKEEKTRLLSTIKNLFFVLDNEINNLDKFDRELYSRIIDITIIGGHSEKGTALPYMVRFIYNNKEELFDRDKVEYLETLKLPTDKTYKILDFRNNYEFTTNINHNRKKIKGMRVTFEIVR